LAEYHIFILPKLNAIERLLSNILQMQQESLAVAEVSARQQCA